MTKSSKSTRPRAPAKHPAPNDKAATEHYHREKARRQRRDAPESDVMAAARREYLALLESDAAKGKGGRPKKKVTPIANADDSEDDNDNE
jgi:polyphosphate kinase 2 (PPK2 family)